MSAITSGCPAAGRLPKVCRRGSANDVSPARRSTDSSPVPGRRLDTGERLDVMHTALLALQHRCVIGTSHPATYHRLGYLRTLNVAA